uniref:Uncharacterized protein n=1 Tax=Lepeophtheirus salmonis TaxID=72036 RepID=A0A0K2VHA0_LEPSM
MESIERECRRVSKKFSLIYLGENEIKLVTSCKHRTLIIYFVFSFLFIWQSLSIQFTCCTFVYIL